MYSSGNWEGQGKAPQLSSNETLCVCQLHSVCIGTATYGPPVTECSLERSYYGSWAEGAHSQ